MDEVENALRGLGRDPWMFLLLWNSCRSESSVIWIQGFAKEDQAEGMGYGGNDHGRHGVDGGRRDGGEKGSEKKQNRIEQ